MLGHALALGQVCLGGTAVTGIEIVTGPNSPEP